MRRLIPLSGVILLWIEFVGGITVIEKVEKSCRDGIMVWADAIGANCLLDNPESGDVGAGYKLIYAGTPITKTVEECYGLVRVGNYEIGFGYTTITCTKCCRVLKITHTTKVPFLFPAGAIDRTCKQAIGGRKYCTGVVIQLYKPDVAKEDATEPHVKDGTFADRYEFIDANRNDEKKCVCADTDIFCTIAKWIGGQCSVINTKYENSEIIDEIQKGILKQIPVKAKCLKHDGKYWANDIGAYCQTRDPPTEIFQIYTGEPTRVTVDECYEKTQTAENNIGFGYTTINCYSCCRIMTHTHNARMPYTFAPRAIAQLICTQLGSYCTGFYNPNPHVKKGTLSDRYELIDDINRPTVERCLCDGDNECIKATWHPTLNCLIVHVEMRNYRQFSGVTPFNALCVDIGGTLMDVDGDSICNVGQCDEQFYDLTVHDGTAKQSVTECYADEFVTGKNMVKFNSKTRMCTKTSCNLNAKGVCHLTQGIFSDVDKTCTWGQTCDQQLYDEVEQGGTTKTIRECYDDVFTGTNVVKFNIDDSNCKATTCNHKPLNDVCASILGGTFSDAEQTCTWNGNACNGFYSVATTMVGGTPKQCKKGADSTSFKSSSGECKMNTCGYVRIGKIKCKKDPNTSCVKSGWYQPPSAGETGSE